MTLRPVIFALENFFPSFVLVYLLKVFLKHGILCQEKCVLLSTDLVPVLLSPDLVPVLLSPDLVPVLLSPDLVPVLLSPDLVPVLLSPDLVPVLLSPDLVRKSYCLQILSLPRSKELIRYPAHTLLRK